LRRRRAPRRPARASTPPCRRHFYDADGRRRLKTFELIVEAVAWEPKPRRPRRHEDDVVYVRIAFHETELRDRAKRLGAIWRKEPKLWDITSRDSRRLGIADVPPAYSALYK
jgi:hypothetical protein